MNWILKLLYACLEAPDTALPETADVVIAIGTDLASDGWNPSNQSMEIILKAMEFYEQRMTDAILCSGGYRVEKITEAVAMMNVVIKSMPRAYLFLEQDSCCTWTNVTNTVKAMEENHWKTAIVVANKLHSGVVWKRYQEHLKGKDIQIWMVKVEGQYGGGTQRRLNNRYLFALWNIISLLLPRDLTHRLHGMTKKKGRLI
ncbi:MAG: ElyC/SanA/YdcF family protein [bacterium]